MRKRHGQPQELEALLQNYLGTKGYLRQSREVLAALLWPQAVGSWYAQHTRVVDVSDGVLTVWCDSAPRAQQLQADAERILELLNRRVEEQFAAKVGVTFSTVNRWENGRGRPSPLAMRQIHALLEEVAGKTRRSRR